MLCGEIIRIISTLGWFKSFMFVKNLCRRLIYERRAYFCRYHDVFIILASRERINKLNNMVGAAEWKYFPRPPFKIRYLSTKCYQVAAIECNETIFPVETSRVEGL